MASKLLFLGAFVVVLFALGFAVDNHSDPFTEAKYKDRFSQFMIKYNRQYQTEEELNKRYNIFREKLIRIEKHNEAYRKGFKTYSIGVNRFSDLTVEEYRQQVLGFKSKNINLERRPDHLFTGVLPNAVDWTQKNAVTDVKDQGQCGSCWSFSSTGTIEGAWAIAKSNLVSCSEQNIIDCSWGPPYNNTGCDGGDMREALTYVINNKGVDTEDSYPYADYEGGSQETCEYSQSNFGASISKLYPVIQGNETDLAWAVTKVPVSVAIDASHDSFQDYEGGIYYEPECGNTVDDLDHGVLVVGFSNSTDWFGDTDYWIVKNSWGEDWGQGGYIWMARLEDNQCGIATYATWVTV